MILKLHNLDKCKMKYYILKLTLYKNIKYCNFKLLTFYFKTRCLNFRNKLDSFESIEISNEYSKNRTRLSKLSRASIFEITFGTSSTGPVLGSSLFDFIIDTISSLISLPLT